jgi:hypothetical protein
MAYGMLTSFALGAAQGLGTAMINKYSKDQDAEIKLKADQEREARIEEAAIRSEGRASTREDLKYNKLRADTLADKETQYAQDYIVKGEDAQRRADEEQRKQAWEKDPTNPSYQSTMQQINASKESVKASESTLENAKLTREKTQLEIDKEKGLADLTSRINAETDSTKRDTLIQQAKVISGKFNDKADQIKTTEIDTGRVDENGKSITKKILVRVEDNGKWDVLPVEERLKMAQPYNKEQADIVARDITNRQLGGARVDNLLLGRDKNNAEQWDKRFTENQAKLLAVKQGDTVSFEGNKKGGMLSLNKGIVTEQPIENPLDKDLNSLYADKVNIGGMRKPNSQEFEPSQGVAKDLRKMDYQLMLYGTGESKNVPKPLTTLRETISTWSPKSDNNDTERLISDASKLLNIKPDDKIDLTDSAVRGQLMKALVKQEHGGQIKGDINKIYQYIDETYGSTPLTNPSNSSKKIISITKEK